VTILRKGHVFIRGVFAGTIQETDEGYCFQYDPEYLGNSDPAPVSLTMPIQTTPYLSKTLFPFFDGLIPEGWLCVITLFCPKKTKLH